MLKVTLASAALALLLGAGCSKETRVTDIDPPTGTFTGSEEVTIKGANFPHSGATVKFGTKPGTQVEMVSDDAIKVQTPAGDKDTNVDVTVVFDDGRAFVLRNGFHYIDSTQQRNTMDKFFNEAAKK